MSNQRGIVVLLALVAAFVASADLQAATMRVKCLQKDKCYKDVPLTNLFAMPVAPDIRRKVQLPKAFSGIKIGKRPEKAYWATYHDLRKVPGEKSRYGYFCTHLGTSIRFDFQKGEFFRPAELDNGAPHRQNLNEAIAELYGDSIAVDRLEINKHKGFFVEGTDTAGNMVRALYFASHSADNVVKIHFVPGKKKRPTDELVWQRFRSSFVGQ